jgi:hypothetical protein
MSTPLVLTDYREPSAVFMIGTDTRIMYPAATNIALSSGEADLAVMEKKTADQLPLVDPAPRPIACIEGFNINTGDPVLLQLMTARPEGTFASCPVPERYRCRSGGAE